MSKVDVLTLVGSGWARGPKACTAIEDFQSLAQEAYRQGYRLVQFQVSEGKIYGFFEREATDETQP